LDQIISIVRYFQSIGVSDVKQIAKQSMLFDNKAFDATPEEDVESTICKSVASTEITNVDSDRAGTTRDVTQTISSSNTSSPSGFTVKYEWKLTKKDQ